eukprot:Clim_evm17s25 gene=Clim_evmTU17s25
MAIMMSSLLSRRGLPYLSISRFTVPRNAAATLFFPQQRSYAVSRSEDHYSLLGVSRSATSAEVKAAFYAKARSAHPDRGGDAEHFKRLTEAYEVLGDPLRRSQYDQYGNRYHSAASSAGGGSAYAYQHRNPNYAYEHQKAWDEFHGREGTYSDRRTESQWHPKIKLGLGLILGTVIFRIGMYFVFVSLYGDELRAMGDAEVESKFGRELRERREAARALLAKREAEQRRRDNAKEELQAASPNDPAWHFAVVERRPPSQLRVVRRRFFRKLD